MANKVDISTNTLNAPIAFIVEAGTVKGFDPTIASATIHDIAGPTGKTIVSVESFRDRIGGLGASIVLEDDAGDHFITHTFGRAQDLAGIKAEQWLEYDPIVLPDAIAVRFLEGFRNPGQYNYIVSGDSTRDNAYNGMIEYYTSQMLKISWITSDNAKSGLRASQWLNNTYPAPDCLQGAIAATPNLGEKTILEYSLGVNDVFSGDDEATIKSNIKSGVEAYKAACPQALVLLVTPVAVADPNDNILLNRIYGEIASELDLPLVDVDAIMRPVYGDPDFYEDSTHPNINGSYRAVNWITSEKMHPSLYGTMTLTDDEPPPPPNTDNLAQPVEPGLWNSSTGAPQEIATWRRMQPIAVEPNFLIKVEHQGNRVDVIFMDDQGGFLLYDQIAIGSPFTIPPGAYEMRLNISDDGDAYDLLGDVPDVRYQVSNAELLTQDEINVGLTLNLEKG